MRTHMRIIPLQNPRLRGFCFGALHSSLCILSSADPDSDSDPQPCTGCAALTLALTLNLTTPPMQAMKREEQWRAKAHMLAADGAVLGPGALEAPQTDPLLQYEPLLVQVRINSYIRVEVDLGCVERSFSLKASR